MGLFVFWMGLCGREGFEECRQLDLLYIHTYLTYFTLPSLLTTYNRYVPTHRLQDISFPLSHFPKLEELAWHGMLATAQVSLGGWQHQRQELPAPLQSLSQFRCSSSALGSERAITVKHVSQSVGERAWTPDPPNCETA